MTAVVRAAVMREIGAFETAQIEIDDPRGDEVLVRIEAAGLCHTDLGVLFGGIPFPMPGVLGHEGTGVIERVGDDIADLAVGDRVVLSFTSCGGCANCAAAHPAYCATWLERNIFRGARQDGSSGLHENGADLGSHFFGQSSFAQYALADRRSVVRVDSDLPAHLLAPLGCGVQTGFGSMWNVLDVGPGQHVAVFGTGAVGLSAVVAAAQRGVETLTAIDIVPERLELARELGATHAVDGRADDLVDQLMAITGGGLDRAFDTTGHPGVARSALDALAANGVVGVCGAPPPGTEIPVDIQGILTGKTLTGITMGDSDPETLVPQLVRLIEEGSLSIDRLTATYELDAINEAVRDMHEGRTVKPVIVFEAPETTEPAA